MIFRIFFYCNIPLTNTEFDYCHLRFRHACLEKKIWWFCGDRLARIIPKKRISYTIILFSQNHKTTRFFSQLILCQFHREELDLVDDCARIHKPDCSNPTAIGLK